MALYRSPDMYNYRLTAAGTLAASVAFSVAANLGMNALYSIENVPATDGHITPDFKREIVPEVVPMRFGFGVHAMSEMPYAPNFASSSEAQKVNDLSLDGITRRIGVLANTTGVEIDRIVIEGRASDEAGSNENAGLGQQDMANLRLADARAAAFGKHFRSALAANEETRSITVFTAPPQEQILANGAIEALRDEATNNGLTLRQAIKRFNSGGSLAYELQADLQESLGDNRGVYVYAEGSKLIPGPFVPAYERQTPVPQQQTPPQPPDLPLVPVVLPVATRKRYPEGDILPMAFKSDHTNRSPVGPDGQPFMQKQPAELQAKFDLI